MSCFLSLPYEVLLHIVNSNSISFDDMFNLSLTCKELYSLLSEGFFSSHRKGQYLAKYSAATADRSFTSEATEFQGNTAAVLRKVAKRREAIEMARTFAVATIGFCDSYLYRQGVLCYTLDHTSRACKQII